MLYLKAVVKLTAERGICVSYAVTIHNSFSDEFYQKVSDKILSDERNNVIVLFIHVSTRPHVSFMLVHAHMCHSC